VRGSVRLLGLPEVAQAKLSAGEITVGAARSLLTLERIAPGRVEAAMNGIIEQHREPNAAILGELKYEKNAQTMQESYEHKKEPLAGEGLWKLSMEPKKFPRLPLLTSAQAQEAGAIGTEGGKRKDEIKGWINQLEGGLVAVEALIAQGAPAETIEKLAHLVNPPACDRCTYYVLASDTHVCGWKACWSRKVQAWAMAEAQKISEKLNIPVYESERDGEFIELTTGWNKEQEQAFKDRIPGLRVIGVAHSNYSAHPVTSSRWVKLLDVTPENVQAQKEKKAERKEAATRQEENFTQQQEQRKRGRANEELSEQFLKKLAIPVFATVWDPIKNEKVFEAIFRASTEYYIEDENGKEIDPDNVILDEKGKNLMRRALTDPIIMREITYEMCKTGPVACAEHLQEVALEWGVRLPEDWLGKARAFTENPPQPEPEEESDEDDE
jgi:hypothetical protein